MHRNIILFDTEYTAWEGSQQRKWSEPWEHREIIQISAVLVDVSDDVIEKAFFDRLVKPKRNPLLSAYITRLTGIQQTDIHERGCSFSGAMAEFYQFCACGQLPLFSWGDDPAILRENCALNEINFTADFPGDFYDIRVLFEQAGIDTRLYSSGTVYQAVGAKLDLASHNALNDVRSLAATIRNLTRTGKISSEWVEEIQSNASAIFLKGG